MSDFQDLSEYEKLRLENIRRNNEFLSQLAIPTLPAVAKKYVSVKHDQSAVKKRKAERKQLVLIPTRKSARLQAIPAESITLPDDIDRQIASKIKNQRGTSTIHTTNDDTITATSKIDYEYYPLESDELDDNEFEVFVHLKQWRLLRSRELELEPYKIFPNRALVEFIRRKRNDKHWATVSAKNVATDMEVEHASDKLISSNGTVKSEAGKDSTPHATITGPSRIKTDTTTATTTATTTTSNSNASACVNDENVYTQLMECWGFGPAKCRSDHFGGELLAFVQASATIEDLLRQSRDFPVVSSTNDS